MKISEFIKKLTAAQKKAAKPFLNKVRELEEDGPGNYVAFVDDGPESRDLKLTLDRKSLHLLEFSCDCRSRAEFCGHKVAMLQAITKGDLDSRSSITRKIVHKKLSPGEQLLREIDDDGKVLAWLGSQIGKDKILELALRNAFLHEPVEVSDKTIIEKYAESRKAVLGRRKTAALNEIPKLLTLLKPHMAETLSYAFKNCEQHGSIKILDVALKIFEEIYFLSKKKSVRSLTFFRKLVVSCADQIEAKNKILKSFLLMVVNLKHNNVELFDMAQILIEVSGSRMNKPDLTEVTRAAVKKIDFHCVAEKNLIKYVNMSFKHGVFADCQDLFGMVYYKNKYNFAVLDKHLALGNYDYIVEACLDIIGNYIAKYQYDYFLYMIKTADLSGDRELIWNCRVTKFHSFPSFSEFLFMYETKQSKEEVEELEELMDELVINGNYSHYLVYVQIKFYYWNETKNYDSILSNIRDHETLTSALLYLDELWEYDKLAFIKAALYAIGRKRYHFDDEFKLEFAQSLKTKITEYGSVKKLAKDKELAKVVSQLEEELAI